MKKQAEEYLKMKGHKNPSAIECHDRSLTQGKMNLIDIMVGFAQSQQSKVDVETIDLLHLVKNKLNIPPNNLTVREVNIIEIIANELSQEDTKEENEVKEDSNREGWISVEDEEPDPLSKCLIYIKDQDFIANGSLEWDDTWTIQYTGEEVEGVTHWMPLPKPPKNN